MDLAVVAIVLAVLALLAVGALTLQVYVLTGRLQKLEKAREVRGLCTGPRRETQGVVTRMRPSWSQ